jgi:ABC-type polysaccharide/polyol phosphate export permease
MDGVVGFHAELVGGAFLNGGWRNPASRCLPEGCTVRNAGSEDVTTGVRTFYDSEARRAAIWLDLLELVRYRDLLGMLIVNITKTRYKRSALGVIWTMLNPLLNMIVLSVAFSSIFRTSLQRYPVYVLTGLVCWHFFSQTTTFAMTTLVWGGNLLKRTYVPRSIFAVASIGNGLINLGLALVPLALVAVFIGHPLHGTWWFVPVGVGLLALFSLGVALLMSTLAVFFVDVVEMYAALLQALFFMTPIMYPKEILPDWVQQFLHVNPMSSIMQVFRDPIYRGVIPDGSTLLTAVAWAFGSLLFGWWVFTLKADEFAYRV